MTSVFILAFGAGVAHAGASQPPDAEARTVSVRADWMVQPAPSRDPRERLAKSPVRPKRSHVAGKDRGSPLRLAKQLSQLFSLMREHMTLNETQHRAVAQLFDAELERLKSRKAEDRGQPSRKETMGQLRSLNREAFEARRNGDDRRAAECKAEIEQLKRQLRSGPSVDPSEFLRSVTAELTEVQGRKFSRLVVFVGIAGSGGDTPSVRAIMTAVLDPDIGLSSDQRRAIRVVIRDHRRSAQGVDLDAPENSDKRAALHGAILAELTAAQQSRLAVALERAEAAARSDVDGGSSRGRDDARPAGPGKPGADGSASPAEPATDGPSNGEPSTGESVEPKSDRTEPTGESTRDESTRGESTPETDEVEAPPSPEVPIPKPPVPSPVDEGDRPDPVTPPKKDAPPKGETPPKQEQIPESEPSKKPASEAPEKPERESPKKEEKAGDKPEEPSVSSRVFLWVFGMTRIRDATVRERAIRCRAPNSGPHARA